MIGLRVLVSIATLYASSLNNGKQVCVGGKKGLLKHPFLFFIAVISSSLVVKIMKSLSIFPHHRLSLVKSFRHNREIQRGNKNATESVEQWYRYPIYLCASCPLASSRSPNSYEYMDNRSKKRTTKSYNLTSPVYQNPDNHINHKVTGQVIVSSHSRYSETLIIAFQDKNKQP